jgi:hypothetical protein
MLLPLQEEGSLHPEWTNPLQRQGQEHGASTKVPTERFAGTHKTHRHAHTHTCC